METSILKLKLKKRIFKTSGQQAGSTEKANTKKIGRKGAAKKVEKPAVNLRETGLQAFEVQRIHRSKLVGALYNPRIITDAERRRLKEGLKRHNLVEPLVWNKRTGNIVGGHQRLSILDSLAGTTNYDLDVSVINVDASKEKELNILLNNSDAQGAWDLDKLAEIFKDKSVEILGTGFDSADIYRLFGDDPLLSRETDLAAYAENVTKAREGFEKAKQYVADRDTTMFYVVVIFRGVDDLADFLEVNKLPASRWQSGDDLRRLLGQPIPEQAVINAEQSNLAGNPQERKRLRFRQPPTPAI